MSEFLENLEFFGSSKLSFLALCCVYIETITSFIKL